MPDEIVQTPSATVETPTTAVDASPLTERERIYQKLYGAPAEPQPTVVETPAPAAPAVAEPVVAQPTDMQAMLTELRALREQVAANTPKPAPVAATPAEESWLKLLADGKVPEGEVALARRLEAEISDRIQARTIERMATERQILSINEAARAANAEILNPTMERYISYGVQSRLQSAVAEGKIQTPADYVTVYKSAVDAEIEIARQQALTFRGAGKQDAATRQREVVSANPLQPNSITQNREPAPAQAAPETASDYFAKRKLAEARGRGLVVA